jgi:hypothetical protein
MKTKFTPGPWNNTPMQDKIWDSEGQIMIARIGDLPWIDGKSDWMTEQANARLISAAPELLAALEALVECPDYRGISTHEMSHAREAIAKAKGGDK